MFSGRCTVLEYYKCTRYSGSFPTDPRFLLDTNWHLNMYLPTGRDGNQFMIYKVDGKTPRVLFEVNNGLVTKKEDAFSSSQEIPSKCHLCLCKFYH